MSRRDAPAPKIVYAGGYEGEGNFPDHRHEHAWELIYLCKGEVVEKSGSDLFEMRPGSFIVHPPGMIHGDRSSGGYFLYHILLTSDVELDWPKSGVDHEGEPIRNLLAMVVREWYQQGIHRDAFIRHCAAQLDILMKRCAVQAEESSVALNVVTTVRGMFRRTFHSPVDLRSVAHDLHISRSSLYAYFHQVLGRTPQEVLDEIRMKHAVHLLKHSKLPIEEIAKGCGYCSSSHLGRKLQRTYRMTARQIRDSVTERESAKAKPPSS